MEKTILPKAHFKFPPLKIDERLRFAIESKECPRFLFKYMSIERIKNFLDNAELLYANPNMFNDPYDCMFNTHTTDTTEEEWRRFFAKKVPDNSSLNYFVMQSMEDPQKAQERVRKGIGDAINTYGMLCLTAKNDDILMWSHYADCHKGVCVMFDILKDAYSFYWPMKVTYSDKYPTFNYIRERNCLGHFLCHKSKKWEYEAEYRIIKPEGYGLSKINIESVVSIIFGCRIEESVEKVIRQKVKDNNFNVKFQRVVQDKESYILNIIDIE